MSTVYVITHGETLSVYASESSAKDALMEIAKIYDKERLKRKAEWQWFTNPEPCNIPSVVAYSRMVHYKASLGFTKRGEMFLIGNIYECIVRT